MEQRHADQMQGEHPKRESPDHGQQQQPSSLNPTAARLVRESILSSNNPKPADGEDGKPSADVSSDILAFARSVDRVDSSLE
ncbi:uncharacterized protein LOC104583460 [Brachypodium distachyon]|uniref:Uncharacterized protein n=1 Tax=Brachypodium distachyon TaxID=15368 RepID=I1HYL9_BRADI|nr:uncharacterized protein LOC104583460 [Brachypodium distachyon]KQJ93972.1 hypothetical protein BRADI_3g07810v3 [Brachypodium distachyon]|eukprot:XP_010234019.1 uncharacterized protein LOC104583460 [Brachypodium distachyon]